MLTSTILYTDGSIRIVNHSADIFFEDKKRKGYPTLREKIEGFSLDTGKPAKATSKQGQRQMVNITFPQRQMRAEKNEIPATVDGLDARQLRRKHKNDTFTMYVNTHQAHA